MKKNNIELDKALKIFNIRDFINKSLIYYLYFSIEKTLNSTYI